MNPQTPIDQVPDEQLATFGWNLVQTHKGHKAQMEQCERNIQAIEQEFFRRSQLRQEQAGKEEESKKTEQDLLVEKLMTKLAERNGTLPKANAAEEEAPKS